ncbi:uncharacterized protein BO96DRAFT_351331 [Aspergillus niger CBS 101883]|uniref:uncharacterized protein n=1 Tax=Aspergillus lacticoffeatus (strain CBS 101883) TaxID=1450533 RepID=UPI000D7F7C91|nr:uncharacterized protein BO96DRAFT_351331 [Aspergillus niger CBS 101883]PYH50954.1 hypothetical protein BO96DRAFT_351331 [Aspergillus niger CBS 101883]
MECTRVLQIVSWSPHLYVEGLTDITYAQSKRTSPIGMESSLEFSRDKLWAKYRQTAELLRGNIEELWASNSPRSNSQPLPLKSHQWAVMDMDHPNCEAKNLVVVKTLGVLPGQTAITIDRRPLGWDYLLETSDIMVENTLAIDPMCKRENAPNVLASRAGGHYGRLTMGFLSIHFELVQADRICPAGENKSYPVDKSDQSLSAQSVQQSSHSLHEHPRRTYSTEWELKYLSTTKPQQQNNDPGIQAPVSSDYVEISIWAFECEGKQPDRSQLNHIDSSPEKRVARKYSRKKTSPYESKKGGKALKGISPAPCYRAATVDSNNAKFMISEQEKQRLKAKG